ncbi:MAG TPA: Mu transposase C-terminal domain-containing protein [Phycisphaerae bacterium]|nr:Mu transposase C-terminal domain-containing protein [Phycisphaerae bacterium]
MSVAAIQPVAESRVHYWTSTEAAARLGLSERAVVARCPVWQARGLARRADGRWEISESADPRLSTTPDSIARDQLADLDKYHQKFVERAQLRLRWVHRHIDLCPTLGEDGAARRVMTEATTETPGLRISVASLRRWGKLYREGGLEALIDGYRTGDRTTRAADAVAYFHSLYRTEKRLSAVWCHEETLRFAKARRLAWPASARSTQNWLHETDDRSTSYLMREGYKAWAHRYLPHIEQDHDALGPGDLYVSDSHRCNFFARDARGKARRPWLICTQDDATRAIVGWCLSFSGNQDTILLAVRQALLGWAIPHALKLDNGRDYRSQLFHGRPEAVPCDRPEWKGLLPELGVKVIFAGAYEPQAKPATERFFGTFNDRFARTLPGYCGRSADERTEAMRAQQEDAASLLSLSEARDRLGVWISQEYHQRPHSGLGGLSPQDKWTRNSASLRKADPAALDLMLHVRGLRRVGPNGVTVRFGPAAIRYAQWDANLRRYAGREVLVACDPQDAGSVVCLDAKTRRVICRATANKRLPPNATGEELREACRQRGRARKAARQAQASASDRLRTVEQIATANYQRQALAATGTHDAAPHAPHLSGYHAVRTGFEEAARSAGKPAGPSCAIEHAGPVDLADWIEDDWAPPGIGDAGTTEDHSERELDSEPETTGLEDW